MGRASRDVEGPNWKEFTAALDAQSSDFKDAIKDLRDDMNRFYEQLLAHTNEIKIWVKEIKNENEERHKAMQLDAKEEVQRLDKRIDGLAALITTVGVVALGALIGFVVDILKINFVGH